MIISDKKLCVSPYSTMINIKIGYTQGELSSDFNDYEDGFRGYSHVIWKFSVINDENAEEPFILVNWTNSGEISKYSGDEELAVAVGQICENTTEDKFGSPIKSECFESLILALFDEPDGYQCMDNVLGSIGGEIIVDEDTDKIPEELVNSLFAIQESVNLEDYNDIDLKNISIKDSLILFGDKIFDPMVENNFLIKYSAFSEDVMRYEGHEDSE